MADDTNNVQFVILTALQLEYQAILAHLPPGTLHSVDGREYFLTKIGNAQIVVTSVNDMGGVAAAIVATQAIHRWNPSYVILTGIAAGLQNAGERHLGDVLIANQVVEYDKGKQTETDFESQFEVFRPSPNLLQVARSIKALEWTGNVGTPRPDGSNDRIVPQSHFGVITSGNRVVKDAKLIEKLRSIWGKMIGLEMEANGVARAAFESSDPTGFFFAKGICDWGDKSKDDVWQPYAAATAAAFVAALIRRYAEGIAPIAGLQTPDELQLKFAHPVDLEIVKSALSGTTGIQQIQIKLETIGSITFARITAAPPDYLREIISIKDDTARLRNLVQATGLIAMTWTLNQRSYEVIPLPGKIQPKDTVSGAIGNRELRKAIVSAFNLEELGLLCDDIQEELIDSGRSERLNLDILGGDGLETRVQRLIEYLQRRDLLAFLFQSVTRSRPGLLPRSET